MIIFFKSDIVSIFTLFTVFHYRIARVALTTTVELAAVASES